jgi:hypothetical protein
MAGSRESAELWVSSRLAVFSEALQVPEPASLERVRIAVVDTLGGRWAAIDRQVDAVVDSDGGVALSKPAHRAHRANLLG